MVLPLFTIIYWLVVEPTPLKNDGVRQLGWWHSQYMEKQNMFQTTNQSTYIFLYFPIFSYIYPIFSCIFLYILYYLYYLLLNMILFRGKLCNQYSWPQRPAQPTSRSTASSSFRWSLFCMIHAWPGVEASREWRGWPQWSVNGNFRILRWRYLPYIRPI